jgi:hypothetical protein
MWDITIHPLKELDDPVSTTRQPMRSALIPNVTARPNLPYIVRLTTLMFCSWWHEPTSELDAPKRIWQVSTSTLDKTSYHSLTRRCEILHMQSIDHHISSLEPTLNPSSFIVNLTILYFIYIQYCIHSTLILL